MHRRVWALSAAILLAATACSGGTSAGAYFSELQDITTVLDTELDDLEGSFNAGLLDINFEAPGADQQLIELFQDSINGVNGSFAELVEGLQTLSPPAALEAPHQEAVDAGLRVLSDYESRADQLSAISTVADIDAYAESLSTSVGRSRFVESCRELQGIADRDEIDVDLNC